MDVQQLLSKYMLEISKVEDEKTLYTALSEVIKRVLDFQVLNILSSGNVIYLEPDGVSISENYYSDYISWVEERLHPTFLPFEDLYVGLVPIFKGKTSLAIAVLLTTSEPTPEIIDYLQLIAYLSGITLENLRLFKMVDDSRKYFETVLNVSNDGIAVFKDTEIEFMNLKAKQILEENGTLLEKIREEVEHESGFFEFEKESTFFSITIKKVEFFGEERFLVSLRNITTEKEIQKLREVDKIKTNFIANISHELRTPLAAIKAYTETMLNMPMTLEEIQEFLTIIQTQSERLENLLNDLLDFSQLESNTMKILKENTDICKIVEAVVKSMKQMANDYDVDIMVDCKNVTVNCDPGRMEQVLLNLVTNAIKFSDKSKEERYAKIEAIDEDDQIRLMVSDNGIGIPGDKLDKIFDKFYRVDNDLTYSIPGTGLGLAIVREIVQLHKGTIQVESEEGKGSIFTVIIPK